MTDFSCRLLKMARSHFLDWLLMLPLLLFFLLLSWAPSCGAQSNSTLPCPLNFTVLDHFPAIADRVKNSRHKSDQCTAIDEGLQAVIALYLRETNYFLIPQGTSAACLNAYQAQLESQGAREFNISTSCSRVSFFSERGTDLCKNIQTGDDFRNAVPVAQLTQLNSSCSQSLGQDTACGVCNLAIVPVYTSLLLNRSGTNSSFCQKFVEVYTVGVVNVPGPFDPSTVLCILYINTPTSSKAKKSLIFIAVGVGAMLVLCLLVALIFYSRYRHVIAAKRLARRTRTTDLLDASRAPNSSINWFSIEDLKKATANFSRANLLGTGGYGNVYKGILQDGTVIAAKRFKNCSPSGDADFVHEVEMISSVRHRNLVAIRGCCVDSSGVMEGHQRIIVYDYMPNGSLQDHLFSKKPKLTLNWPMRENIAIGIAKGLAYLHHDAMPAIFHRDIKPSNILLDTDFNPRLADFGLAKFTPEGVSHLTTRAAGTYGYVAPEYAMYGQLTEKSDVYSFGMVLLELVTGKKALSSPSDDPSYTLIPDWAWPLVKQGRWRIIIDEAMTEVGPDDVMQNFILVGLLCAHPQVFYRPSIDHALKMLENTGVKVPFPDRPLPLTSNQMEIEEAMSREETSHLGFSSYSMSSVSTSNTHDYTCESPRSPSEPTVKPLSIEKNLSSKRKEDE